MDLVAYGALAFLERKREDLGCYLVGVLTQLLDRFAQLARTAAGVWARCTGLPRLQPAVAGWAFFLAFFVGHVKPSY